MVISVSGKGGTGKTTLTALILRTLIKNSKKKILVVDADPATNLPDVLGININTTVGDAATKLKKEIEEGSLSPSIQKQDLLESRVYEALIETRDFDFLPMGRSEGEGCYCYVNSILTRILDVLTKNYDITLMDMEAGLEHLSRRTDRDVDIMIIITDPSKMGFETARRIKEVAEEVHINFKEIFLVGNKFNDSQLSFLKKKSEEIGIKFLGYLPYDENVATYNLDGKSLLNLPPDSPSVKAAEDIVRNAGLLRDEELYELLREK